MIQPGYWVVKGNPRYPLEGVDARCGDIEGFLADQEKTTWVTYKHIPPDCHINDRVFFWQSSPHLHIMGLGVITDIDSRKSDENHFTIYHKLGQSRLRNPIGIKEIINTFQEKLRPDEWGKGKAGYVKRSVVATLYRVLPPESKELKELIYKANPSNKIIQEWRAKDNQHQSVAEQKQSSKETKITPLEEIQSSEGAPTRTLVTVYERDPRLRQLCINHYTHEMRGRIHCYVCEFDFEARYGKMGKDYIHVHHELQLSLRKEKHRPDPIKEMKPLCANCHAMIHLDPKNPLSVQELKRRLK